VSIAAGQKSYELSRSSYELTFNHPPSRQLSAFLGALLLMNYSTMGQEAPPAQDVRTRDMWDSSLLSQRPAGKAKPLPKIHDDGLVGITLWRLRPSEPGDRPEVRSLIHEENQSHQWTPERVSIETPLHEGQKVRISIETARTGYLYVIDCDEYADGSKSDSYLIFPTLRTSRGNNRVTAGTVVEIPASDDNPSYFTVKRSRPDQTNENLTILVRPRPIENLQISPERLRISPERVAIWKKESKTASYRLEAPTQAGKPYTLEEKKAGLGEKQLTQDDPLPQTLYYVPAKPGETLAVELPLRISR
jgi:hypothetical protein